MKHIIVGPGITNKKNLNQAIILFTALYIHYIYIHTIKAVGDVVVAVGVD